MSAMMQVPDSQEQREARRTRMAELEAELVELRREEKALQSAAPPAADGAQTVRAPVRAVIFDKDGTLVDFEQTWEAGLRASAAAVAAMPGCSKSATELLKIDGMDAASGRVEQDSLISEATAPEIAEAWSQQGFDVRPDWVRTTDPTPGKTGDALRAILEGIWSSTLQYTAAPLGNVDHTLAVMHASGIKLGCVTNDTQAEAEAQLETLGVLHLFGAVIGYDSGHGRKPEPGGVLAACAQLGVDPAEAVMVGDSPGDIAAGKAAGCVGRVSVNASARAAMSKMEHGDATHDVNSVEDLLELLGLEEATETERVEREAKEGQAQGERQSVSVAAAGGEAAARQQA